MKHAKFFSHLGLSVRALGCSIEKDNNNVVESGISFSTHGLWDTEVITYKGWVVQRNLHSVHGLMETDKVLNKSKLYTLGIRSKYFKIPNSSRVFS